MLLFLFNMFFFIFCSFICFQDSELQPLTLSTNQDGVQASCASEVNKFPSDDVTNNSQRYGDELGEPLLRTDNTSEPNCNVIQQQQQGQGIIVPSIAILNPPDKTTTNNSHTQQTNSQQNCHLTRVDDEKKFYSPSSNPLHRPPTLSSPSSENVVLGGGQGRPVYSFSQPHSPSSPPGGCPHYHQPPSSATTPSQEMLAGLSDAR